MGHLAVDLCDPVVLDPVKGIGPMDIQFGAERMTVFLHRQGILSVGLFEASWSTMDRNHAQLLLRPFLSLAIAELNRYFAGTFDADGAAGFFPIHIDGEVSRKPLKVFLPPGGPFERSAQ